MPKIDKRKPSPDKIPGITRFEEAYVRLNEGEKQALRNAFNEEFSYESTNTFYIKLNGSTPLWNHEKRWLADYFKMTVEELFPGKEENNG